MTSNELLKEYEEELILIQKSKQQNFENGSFGLVHKREIQEELVCRFIKDLKKLMV